MANPLPPLGVRRKRKSVTQLYSNLSEDDTPAPPLPPRDISLYSKEHLKNNQQYANHTLRSIKNKKRKVTPTAQLVLKCYQKDIQSILDEAYNTQEEKDDILRHIRVLEQYMAFYDVFKHALDTQDDLLERLAELRRYEFAARYGDYVARLCEQVKVTARLEKTEYFEEITGWANYWTDIHKRIYRERDMWEAYKMQSPLVKPEDVKASLAVANACDKLGLDTEDMLMTIALYANRNDLVHQNLDQFIEHQQWDELKATLARDRRDIPYVTPPELRGNVPILEDLVDAAVDTYFVRTDDEERMNPLFWTPRKHLYKDHLKVKEQKAKKYEARMAEEEEILRRAEEKLKKHLEDYQMVGLIAATLGKPGPTATLPPPPDQPLTQDEKATELKKYYKRKRLWDAIVGATKKGQQFFQQYYAEYKTADAPVHPEAWWDLAEETESGPGPST